MLFRTSLYEVFIFNDFNSLYLLFALVFTLAVMKKETQSWPVVLGALVYLFGLAYLASFLVYQILS